jgi:hypothetical protein
MARIAFVRILSTSTRRSTYCHILPLPPKITSAQFRNETIPNYMEFPRKRFSILIDPVLQDLIPDKHSLQDTGTAGRTGHWAMD